MPLSSRSSARQVLVLCLSVVFICPVISLRLSPLSHPSLSLLPFHLMSSLILVGNLGLFAARRVSGLNPSTKRPTSHIHYSAHIQLTNGTSALADLRVYASTGRPILPEGTVAFVIAKLCRASGDPAEDDPKFHLDAITIEPHPGDPSAEEYDSITPDNVVPWIWAVGSVASNLNVMPDKKSKSFKLIAADWVRDDVQTSTLYGRFDGGNSRWTTKGPPSPAKSSVVQIVGPLSALREDGNLEVTIEHITLALGTGAPAIPSASTPNSPTKKRKYGAAQTTSSPVASSSHVLGNAAASAPAASTDDAPEEYTSEPETPAEPVQAASSRAGSKRRR